uniref:Uncharacterized protein n=1 Tax=Rhizophagus irregularis (strain DAOM 181602 / DAOM 197198 / MUCL 43194) TaxID=747089 RepID=U9TP19_RHIID
MDPRATSSSAEVSSRTIFPPITPITSPMKMDPAMQNSPMLEEVVEIINENNGIVDGKTYNSV